MTQQEGFPFPTYQTPLPLLTRQPHRCRFQLCLFARLPLPQQRRSGSRRLSRKENTKPFTLSPAPDICRFEELYGAHAAGADGLTPQVCASKHEDSRQARSAQTRGRLRIRVEHTALHIIAEKEWSQRVLNGNGRRDRGSEEGKSRSWLCCPSANPSCEEISSGNRLNEQKLLMASSRSGCIRQDDFLSLSLF